MGERAAEHVGREAEETAADERRPRRVGHVAAEQKRRPGGERRHQECGHVVGDDRAGRERQRRERHCEPRRALGPGEVDPVRHPDRLRHQRVLAVQDRMRPPRERPDEDLRIGSEASYVVAARMGEDPDAEHEDRDGGVAGECQRRDAAASRTKHPSGRPRANGARVNRRLAYHCRLPREADPRPRRMTRRGCSMLRQPPRVGRRGMGAAVRPRRSGTRTVACEAGSGRD